MKVVMGKFSVNLDEKAMAESGKDDYVKRMSVSLEWTGLDPAILKERLGEVYELTTGR